jgi:hypothetical protein
MHDVINGQIVPALGPGQGFALIVIALALAHLLQSLWRHRRFK